MVQIIEDQGNIWGRIGKGFGKGLAETVPKEVERSRLAAGLRELEREAPNLTPLQQYTRLAAIPGMTPAILQQFPEISKQEGMRRSYDKFAGKGDVGEVETRTPSGKPSIKDIKFGGEKLSPTVSTEEEVKQLERPQVQTTSPLDKNLETRVPWSPEQRDTRIAEKLRQFPYLTVPEAMAQVADDERRFLETPEYYQKENLRLEEASKDARLKLNNSLSLKLQKNPPIAGPKGTVLPNPETYTDLTGEDIANLERNMEADLRLNPNLTVDNVVNKWTNKALDLAKTKSQINKLAKSGLSTLNPQAKKENFRTLQSAQKIFDELGSLEEYYNVLQSKFGMSPQGAAFIAYPRSDKVQKTLKDYKLSTTKNGPENSRNIAHKLLNNLSLDDSVLAIAKELKRKDNFFDEFSFYDELSQNQDKLSQRQQRELLKGADTDFLPNWGDFWILPYVPPPQILKGE